MVILSLMIIIIAIALTSVNNKNNIVSLILSNKNKNMVNLDYPEIKSPVIDINIAEGIPTKTSNSIWFTRITSLVFLFSGVLAFNSFYIQSIGSGISIFNGLFNITTLSQGFDIIIFILAGIIILPWNNFYNILNIDNNLNKSNINLDSLSKNIEMRKLESSDLEVVEIVEAVRPTVKEFSLIVLFTTLGSSLLLSSSNLLSLYLSLELQSFGVYILSSIYRDSETATNAGLKYFLLGGLSSCIILLGCVLIYSYTGSTNLEDLNSLLLSNCNNSILQSIQLGLILIFIGFLFKIAAAPFHNWAPDVYNDVPSIITIWLTIMPKIAIIILTVDILNIINLDILSKLPIIESIIPLNETNNSIYEGIYTENLIKNLFLISSFLSLMIGTIVGLAQNKIKRLLAYSTISHIGFILLALSVNTEESLESVLFYLIQYSFTNLNIFFIILALGYQIKSKNNINKMGNIDSQVKESQRSEAFIKTDINFISELKGEFKNNPLLTLSLAICLFSMAGIPPLLGFFAKAGVLYSSIKNGYYFISFIAIIVSVISAYYYLAIIKVMHFDKKTQIQLTHKINNKNNINNDNFIPELKGEFNKNLKNLDFFNSNSNSNNNYINNINLSNINKITNIHSFTIAILTLFILLFILKPATLLNSIHIIALNIFFI